MRGPTAHPRLLAETKKPRMAAPCTAMPSPWKRGPARERSDRFLELLGRAERDFLAGLDLDRLAGRRIASHPGGAVAHLHAGETRARMPSPTMRRRLPFFRCLTMFPTMSLSIVSACFFAISWLSASSAARCLRVTVGWGFPDFLAAIVDRLLFEGLAKRFERLASDAADRGLNPYEIRPRHATVIHGYALLTAKCGRGQYATGRPRGRRGRPDPRERA